MSHVGISTTPFINDTILIAALERSNVSFTVKETKIETSRKDFYGQQYFEKKNHSWVFRSDTSEAVFARGNSGAPVRQSLASDFIREVREHYYRIEREIEEQRRKLEKERQQKIEEERCKREEERQQKLEELRREIEDQQRKLEEDRLRGIAAEKRNQNISNLQQEREAQLAGLDTNPYPQENMIEEVDPELERLEKHTEQLRIEKEAYVQSQKEAIIEKAEKQGFKVREKKIGQKVQLVLVRQR